LFRSGSDSSRIARCTRQRRKSSALVCWLRSAPGAHRSADLLPPTQNKRRVHFAAAADADR
jgi:hypothetical protein